MFCIWISTYINMDTLLPKVTSIGYFRGSHGFCTYLQRVAAIAAHIGAILLSFLYILEPFDVFTHIVATIWISCFACISYIQSTD